MVPAPFAALTILFAAPSVLFSLAFVQKPWGELAAVLWIAAVAPLALRAEWRRPRELRLAIAAAAIAIALTLISGVGHLFYQTDDWTTRDAILLDLVRYPWPVGYETVDGVGYLRAPLGMYLAPAAIGKIFGGAEAALFVQNGSILALCLYALAGSLPNARTRWFGLLFFIAFAGLDIVAWARRWLEGAPDNLALPHLDPWAGNIQFSSHVTQLFWTPHHALAGWAIAAAYQMWRTGRAPALLIAPLCAAAAFWSPLAALGGAPFVAFALYWDWRDGKLRFADFAGAGAAGTAILPIAYFLTRDTAGIAKGFLDFSNMTNLRSYLGVVLIKAAPWLAVAWHGCDRQDRRARAEFALIAMSLVLIPTYSMGVANDFAMRVSIPALALLCLRAAPTLANLLAEPPARRVMLASFVMLGAATPAVEIARNITMPANERSACNVVEAIRDEGGPGSLTPLGYYVASSGSLASGPALLASSVSPPVRTGHSACWPGRRFVYAWPVPPSLRGDD